MIFLGRQRDGFVENGAGAVELGFGNRKGRSKRQYVALANLETQAARERVISRRDLDVIGKLPPSRAWPRGQPGLSRQGLGKTGSDHRSLISCRVIFLYCGQVLTKEKNRSKDSAAAPGKIPIDTGDCRGK